MLKWLNSSLEIKLKNLLILLIKFNFWDWELPENNNILKKIKVKNKNKKTCRFSKTDWKELKFCLTYFLKLMKVEMLNISIKEKIIKIMTKITKTEKEKIIYSKTLPMKKLTFLKMNMKITKCKNTTDYFSLNSFKKLFNKTQIPKTLFISNIT